MAIALFHTLPDVTLRVDDHDGIEHRIQRGSDTVVRRGDNGTETQGISGVVGVHGGHNRIIVAFRRGIFLPMENRRAAERVLSSDLHMPRHDGALRRRCYLLVFK